MTSPPAPRHQVSKSSDGPYLLTQCPSSLFQQWLWMVCGIWSSLIMLDPWEWLIFFEYPNPSSWCHAAGWQPWKLQCAPFRDQDGLNHILNYVLYRSACLSLVLTKAKSPGRAKLTPSHLTCPLIENNSKITEQYGIGTIFGTKREATKGRQLGCLRGR